MATGALPLAIGLLLLHEPKAEMGLVAQIVHRRGMHMPYAVRWKLILARGSAEIRKQAEAGPGPGRKLRCAH